MDNQQLISSSRQRPSTPVGFCQGFLSKEQCDNTKACPILFWLGYSWFLSVPSPDNSNDGKRLFDVTDIRMRRKSWKGFHKMFSRKVSDVFTVAGRIV